MLSVLRQLGIRVQAVMTAIFRSEKFQRVLRWLRIRHKITSPARGKREGEVVHLHLLNEWA